MSFYFPRHRLVVTNMMVTGAIFNIYTLRGGPFRNPEIFIDDARWVESKNAEILLDIHGPTLKGEKVVHEASERAVDQVQLIHDQTLRLIAHGMDAREAEGKRLVFTIAAEGEPRIKRVELRNSVLVISYSDAASPTHVTLTRQELAAFVLGTRSSAAGDALTELDRVLDRSHLMPAAARESVLVPEPGKKISDDLEH